MKKQMDQIKNIPIIKTGKKTKKKSSAHFNLTNSTHETAVVRQLLGSFGCVWVVLKNTDCFVCLILIPFPLMQEKKKKFNPALRRK